ncbi:MAG: hypothetical protein JKY53_04790 [Flavobacteriales bacterium]|nr:hypothetical protein [Flavobacteriales bacterium]
MFTFLTKIGFNIFSKVIGSWIMWKGETNRIIHLENRKFNQVIIHMPSLSSEIKADLLGKGQGSIREFFISPSKTIQINTNSNCFIYYVDEHSELRNWIVMLESAGYIEANTDRKYTFNEHFIEQILEFVEE